ncbi:uncharacterized protein CcaverHIS019_0508640 [Cutaneotrichosporon cavernicola]|uniref:Recombination protein Rad52 n=1 Tax=Cutaneotrichosporon cavernicola TaxID=279322 RepID=A0AA48L7B1_9TREE|nr:uncharacterized protein CcaverHIS019_0508640 [Cutaneotrichosporon cavernicola]BEI93236.1 hypothetical protein CcaverHIS019_0508640 [Cutaneotrichosporon cavernicola]BEJ01013.1 hypothetical protein CcaverHIS631_0508700 [Cutaneotrichosporon cavernicola]
MVPPQTPTTSRTTYQAAGTPLANSVDGSQFGMHHGMPMSPFMSQGFFGTPGPAQFTTWSEEKVATMQARLQRQLGPEYVTQRAGHGGGGKLSYIEGWKVINLANEVFGFNGWSSSITRLQTDFLDVDANERVKVGITAIIRITLRDGCYHEDLGYGQAENVRGKATALEKAQKEAVTDGVKRALKHFGNVLGNCLYDKEYCKQVQRMRVGPAKWNPDELERRPEFTPGGGTRPPVAAPPAASAVPSHVSGNAKPPAPAPPVRGPAPPAPRFAREETPLRSIDENTVPVEELNEDSEYAFMESESLFDDMDQSVLGARVDCDVPMLGEERLTRSESAPGRNGALNNAPTYQHRHRPDMPPPVVPVQNGGSSLVESNPSNGTRSDAGEEGVRKKVVGGFAMPNGPGNGGANGGMQPAASRTPPESAADAAARRRAAIQASFKNDAPPPNMPLGGVDCVASRANGNLHAHGADLGIPNGNGPGFGGFASARGVKRESNSQSPTKMERSRSGGPRPALSEIPVDANEWASKRSRVI